MMAEVTYICKRTVVSTKPVEPAGKLYPLSVLDRLAGRNHLRIVYYFQTPRGGEIGEVTKKLRESMSEMLSFFPLVIGRLVKDQDGHWMIKCNDAGVRMVEAKAKGSVEEWLRSVDRDKELKLVHWQEMYHKPYFWSTLYAQLTEFEEGGLAIGMSCSHLLADSTSAKMFIKAWADTTLAGKMSSPPLFGPLSSRIPKDPNRKPYAHLINHYKSIIENTHQVANKRCATVAVAFTDLKVRECIEMAGSEQTSPSPFEALSGLFWVCISKLKGITNGLMDMSICLDTRKVLGLDKEFFGNWMVYNKVKAETAKGNKLSGAAKAIGEVVAEMGTKRIMDLIDWLERHNYESSPPMMNGPDLMCASLEEGVDPYSAMFEEGLGPIRVSYHVEPVVGAGQVLILPSPPAEGPLSRVVMVTLPEDEAIEVISDELITQFSPTLSMGIHQN